jgi:putative nucleotidyltransferase with HDIG domain
MKHVKTIPLDQLKPGMFIVGMDQPWYRTPFLLHKRLIRHQNDIDLLRQHGIREVKIDPGQGLDVEPTQSRDELPRAHTQETVSATHPDHPVKQTSPEKAAQTKDREENSSARPPLTQKNTPLALPTQEQAEAALETYREATRSMERMFEELETGLIPQQDSLRSVVTNVLSRVLADSTSMLSLLSLQKMKRFDRTLASHAIDVCTLSLIVAHDYGVTEGEMEALGAGALLHDIGYVRLPRNLYRKSQDLTEQERSMMQQHPALGLAILRDTQENREAVVRIVGEHHECSNGSGFPHKLRGDSLSVLAQLVGLVDVYDGLVSRRGGRSAMLPHDAIRQLFRLGDMGQYAKDLIQTMIGSLGVYPIGSLVLMNTREQAVVVGINTSQRLKPVIKVITGPQGQSYLPPILIDLGTQAPDASARTITKVLDPLQERVNVAMFLDEIHEEAA